MFHTSTAGVIWDNFMQETASKLVRILKPTQYYASVSDLTKTKSLKLYVCNSRCIRMAQDPYNCASFSFYGLATDSSIYPGPWKAAMFFLSFCKLLIIQDVIHHQLNK